MSGQNLDVSAAVEQYIQGEKRNMEFIINHVSKAHATDKTVKKFFDECALCLDHLPQHLSIYLFELFIGQRLWYSFASEQAESCLFLVLHIALRCEHLVEQLLTTICEGICHPPKLPDESTNGSQIILKALREFLALSPQSETQLIETLHRTLPNWGRPAPHILTAVANILKLCYITPRVLNESSVQRILDFLFVLLVDIEINLESAKCETDPIACPISDLSHPFDVGRFDQNLEKVIQTVTPMTDSANLVLWLLIMCIQQIFPDKTEVSKSSRKGNWIQLCAVFRDLRTRFVQRVLPVQSTFSAFSLLLIHTSSLRPGLMVSLLENLWRVVIDTRHPEEVRCRCMTYLADYLARGARCTPQVVLEQLSDFTTWCVEYTYFRRSRPPSKFSRMLTENPLFYIVFEAIIHVITYRQAELIGITINRHQCASLPLGQLINCPLRPLDGLKQDLRDCFISVATAYKMTWTMTIPAVSVPVYPNCQPQSSYKCPFSEAVASVQFASQLGLICDYAAAKRVHKRRLQNGNTGEQSSSTIASSCEDQQQALATKRKKVSRKIKAKHFNFNALANLD